MARELPIIRPTRKTGNEEFRDGGAPLGPRLNAYWQWAASDLVGNTERGGIAEYLVAVALGVADGVRSTWDSWDVTTPGGIKVEVKSSAYIQAWAQREYSRIEFGVGPRASWDPQTGVYGTDRVRQADVYVFCVLANRDQDTLDPLDVGQWEFYMLSTAVLDREVGRQERLSLSRVVDLGARKVRFGELAGAIALAARSDP